MKAVRINTDREQSLANALVALKVRFVYEYGTYYLLGTSDENKIRNFLERNDVRTEGMTFKGVEYEF